MAQACCAASHPVCQRARSRLTLSRLRSFYNTLSRMPRALAWRLSACLQHARDNASMAVALDLLYIGGIGTLPLIITDRGMRFSASVTTLCATLALCPSCKQNGLLRLPATAPHHDPTPPPPPGCYCCTHVARNALRWRAQAPPGIARHSTVARAVSSCLS